MLREIRPAIMMMVLFTLVGGLAYPLGMTQLAQLLFPRQAAGSLVTRDGQVVGSSLIGQNFSKPEYFHPRPSATSGADPNDSSKTVAAPYNAAASTGSNLGPTSKALLDRVTADAKTLQADDPTKRIPADLVTTSASGLDPDISPAAADFQVARVAAARKLPEERVRRIVAENTQGRIVGILGEPHVNVLALNMALDAAR